MDKLLTDFKRTKELSEGILNIPLTYIIFLIALFLAWQPQYIEWINAYEWVPENLIKIILGFGNLLYSNLGKIIMTLILLFAFIYCLSNFTPLLNKMHNKREHMSDGTTLSLNSVSAQNRIVRAVLALLSTIWIYYFLALLLFNESQFAENFFYPNLNGHENEIVKSGFMTKNLLWFMNILFLLNTFVLLCFVIRSLFLIKLPTRKNSMKEEEIEWYITINSFSWNNHCIREGQVLLLKESRNHRKKSYFYLIERQPFQPAEPLVARKDNRHYEIINESDNFEEIVYHYESLCDTRNKSGNTV